MRDLPNKAVSLVLCLGLALLMFGCASFPRLPYQPINEGLLDVIDKESVGTTHRALIQCQSREKRVWVPKTDRKGQLTTTDELAYEFEVNMSLEPSVKKRTTCLAIINVIDDEGNTYTSVTSLQDLPEHPDLIVDFRGCASQGSKLEAEIEIREVTDEEVKIAIDWDPC